MDGLVTGEVIEVKNGPLTQEGIAAFLRATRSECVTGMPPTFPTVYRQSEFAWLHKLNIDMRNLLHTDQEYEYLVPLRQGDMPVVQSKIVDARERSGLLFIVLETIIRCQDVLKIRCWTTFVLRGPLKEQR
jgi:hypothetical protein